MDLCIKNSRAIWIWICVFVCVCLMQDTVHNIACVCVVCGWFLSAHESEGKRSVCVCVCVCAPSLLRACMHTDKRRENLEHILQKQQLCTSQRNIACDAFVVDWNSDNNSVDILALVLYLKSFHSIQASIHFSTPKVSLMLTNLEFYNLIINPF